MKKQKMYFIDGIDYSMSESEVREWLLEYGLSEIKASEAIPAKIDGFFYCKLNGVGDKSESTCGKSCSDYVPRNGKRGTCKYRGKLYEAGENETIIKLHETS